MQTTVELKLHYDKALKIEHNTNFSKINTVNMGIQTNIIVYKLCVPDLCHVAGGGCGEGTPLVSSGGVIVE